MPLLQNCRALGWSQMSGQRRQRSASDFLTKKELGPRVAFRHYPEPLFQKQGQNRQGSSPLVSLAPRDSWIAGGRGHFDQEAQKTRPVGPIGLCPWRRVRRPYLQ